MDKKTKILLLLLGIVSLSLAGISAWIYLSSQSKLAEDAKKEAELEKQSAYLQAKLDSNRQETRHWREKSEAIIAALNRLGKEHTLLETQYDSLLKKKDSIEKENEQLSTQLEKLNKLYFQQQEKAKLSSSEKFMASLVAEKAEKEVEIGKLKGRISSQEAQLEDAEKRTGPSKERFERLEKELQDARKVSNVLSSDLLKEKKARTSLEEELAGTEGYLKNITQERDKLTEQLVKMKQALEQRLVELSQTKKVLEGAVEGARDVVTKQKPAAIELPPIIVKAEEQAAVAKFPELNKAHVIKEATFELAGRIITANDRYRFVVIDIGRGEGVEKGMGFDVYRKGAKIGKIEVIEVRKTISACDIKEMDVRHLQVNDTVRR